VVVDVEFGGGKIKAAVADDGRGFDSSVGLSDLPRKGKLGLAGIQERVRLLGGSLRVQSEPGKGTSVSVEVPSQTASRE
jgi:two-component system sensor histidine kinase DegS